MSPIDLIGLPVGTLLRIGDDAVLLAVRGWYWPREFLRCERQASGTAQAGQG